MPKFETTRDALIERLARIGLHDWKSGTCTGGSTGTVVDTSLEIEPDDYFQNTVPVSKVYIRTTTDGAAPIGESRGATDFVSSGGTITIDLDYTASVEAGDTYGITTLFDWNELVAFIETAIDVVRYEHYIHVVDEDSIALIASVYEYPLPVGLSHLYRVTMADGNGKFYDSPVPSDQYSIIQGFDTPRIHFHKFPDESITPDIWYGNLWATSGLTAARKLRVEGFGVQAALSTDLSICYINPDFVFNQAAAFAHLALSSRGDTDPANHLGKAAQYQVQADRIRVAKGFQTRFPPDIKRVI